MPNKRIYPKRLREGATIGVVAPCWLMRPEYVEPAAQTLCERGFQVKLAQNLFADSYGYAASAQERADDFNAMIADPQVDMLLFGGGEVCNELLPLLDYENIVRNPKIICSYSDSTTLLNAIHAKTGVVTFYGASLRTFDTLRDYNWSSFSGRLMAGELQYEKGSTWNALHGGSCCGTLTGGYLVNYAFLQNSAYFTLDPQTQYLLFLEDHEKFSAPAVVAKYLAHLEQSGLFRQVCGLIVGEYAKEEPPLLSQILARIGETYRIPVVKHADFGHGENNAIYPIGVRAKLDADAQTLTFLESGVQ